MDFLRSKSGVNNTYLRGDLNILEYERENMFPETVKYVRNWIEFRKSKIGQLLRPEQFPSGDNYKIHIQPNSPALAVSVRQGKQQIFFAINPSEHGSHIEFDEQLPKLSLQATEREFFNTP